MRTVAIIQARMGSTRLPGKVLMPLGGEPALKRVVERVGAAPGLDEVVVATTTESADDAIVELCKREGCSFFRGSEEDVLSRYYEAARQFKADVIVRVSSDCPLFDSEVLGQMLARFEPDYLNNFQKRTFPRGFEAEVFTFGALETAHREATKAHEREHVTPFIYQHPDRFKLHSFEEPSGNDDLTALRWTLDTPADYDVISAIYNALARPGEIFSTADILNLLRQRPELTKINAHVEQRTVPR
jgi:spore coat polysaccharide biosynthesis protein SpsF